MGAAVEVVSILWAGGEIRIKALSLISGCETLFLCTIAILLRLLWGGGRGIFLPIFCNVSSVSACMLIVAVDHFPSVPEFFLEGTTL